MAENKPQPMRGPGGPTGAGEKPKNFKATFKRFCAELKVIRLQLLLTILFSFISVICAIFAPKFMGEAINVITEYILVDSASQTAINLFSNLTLILVVMASLYVANYLFSLLVQILMGRASSKVAHSLRTKLKLKLNKLPLNFYDTTETGNTLSVFVNDVDNIASSLQQSLAQIITSVTTIVGVLVMMLTINFWLTLVVVAVLPISIGLTTLVMKKSQKFFKSQASTLGKLNSHIEETYTNQKTVKSFSNEQMVIDEFESVNKELFHSSLKSNFFSGLLMPFIIFTNNLGYVVLSLVGCIFIFNGLSATADPTIFSATLEIGFLITFLSYSQQFTQPISNLSQILNTFQTALAASERVFAVLDEQNEVEEEVTATAEKFSGDIVLKNVKFGYNPDDILMQKVNCTIPKGKTVAIVGPTGAGKTTLVNLIMRFYELNGGQITIDGVDITTLSRSNLRKHIGMVLQETWLFHGSVLDNLKYGNPYATFDEIKAVCKSVHAHHFIKTLEHGYDTIINEAGTNISQGQKQLLTIARAIIANPDIMILDEATSNIDTRTEVLVQNAMAMAMENRTSFVIAHRLSTIVNADIILVFNNGDIVEQGNHNSLMKSKGFYYNLYNSQFE